MALLNSKKGRELAFKHLYRNYESMNDAEFSNWSTAFVEMYATKIHGKQKKIFLDALQSGKKKTVLMAVNNLIMAMDGHKTISLSKPT